MTNTALGGEPDSRQIDPSAQSRRRVTRPAGAVVVGAALLLAIGSTGGAVAGSLITGKQIKNNTVTTADIKNKTITKKDLAKSARPRTGRAGAQGPRGATGPVGPPGVAGVGGADGAPGQRGSSAWDTIPSGVTVTGSTIWQHTVQGAAAGEHALSVDLPGVAPVPLTYETVRFAPSKNVKTGRDDPACTGTPSAPTAPAGQVCIYIRDTDQMVNIQGYVVTLPTRSFAIVWDLVPSAAETKNAFMIATWAYTAP